MADDEKELLKATGEALYGERYKVALGDDLKVRSETIKSFGNGRMAIPAGVWGELEKIVRARLAALQALLPRIEKAKNKD